MQFTDQADFAALKSYHVAQWIDNNEAASRHPGGAFNCHCHAYKHVAQYLLSCSQSK